MIKPETKESIIILRQQGESFAEIGKALSLSPNTVKSICRRNGIKAETAPELHSNLCKNCGKTLLRPPGDGRRTFCSNQCRYQWWNQFRSRTPYRLTCYYCGREFISFGNRKKKFCSRECYRLGRYGGNTP